MLEVQNFYKSIVTEDWSIGTGNFYVSEKPRVEEGWLVVSPNNSTIREVVYYNGTGTDGNGDYINIVERGVGDTVEQIHSIGEPIRMNVDENYWNYLSETIDGIVATGSPDADTSTKGIVQIARKEDLDNGEDVGSSGATNVVPPSLIKFINKSPVVRVYEPIDFVRKGDNNTSFNVTNPSGNIWRYTYNGTGTDPNINSTTMPVGDLVRINSGVSVSNRGTFEIKGNGGDYFEVEKENGTVENNKTNVGLYYFKEKYVWEKPDGLKYIEVEVQAGGGSGQGGYSSYPVGNPGGDSYFGDFLSATGGGGGGAGGNSGIGVGGDVNIPGAKGLPSGYKSGSSPVMFKGGISFFADGGILGMSGILGSGGGGGGSSTSGSSIKNGGSGGGGGYSKKIITESNLPNTVVLKIGVGGTESGTSGAGGNGIIIIKEYFV